MDREHGQNQVEKGDDLGDRAVALAEQLGRIIGTMEGTAGSWMNRSAVTEQLTRVRDNASRLLETLGESATEGRKAVSTGVRQATAAADSAMASIKTLSSRVKPAGKKTTAKSAAAGRKMADKAHAPGKRHRKPAPTAKGVKKSDQRIVKMRTAQAARQRRKSYA